MIKQDVIKIIKFTIFILSVYLFSFILQLNLIIPTVVVALIFYYRQPNKFVSTRNPRLLELALLFMLSFSIVYFLLRNNQPWIYIPFALVPMLSVVLFERLDAALLLSVIVSITTSALDKNNYYMAILSLISGISASMLCRNIRRRQEMISAGFLIGAIQVVCWLFINNFQITEFASYIVLFVNGIFSAVITLGILPIFEYLFKTVTSISLLELADFNHPLLQRLFLEAPGTYHHSLMVGNLSEAACRAVDAHALLARVGAYYHDIGKLTKPDYFSENQSISHSKHDDLSPTMSKLVIMNHVKDGLELAKKHNLNPLLLGFIHSHHGNSLVYYFYRRALEELEEDEEVKEEGFRYAGPKPKTKETAIVLLADSVEAAARALKEADHAKIEEVVHKIINNKFIDGQLDECNLTLKDLEKISAVFIHILSGIYHSRISYPEKENSEDNHKKSAKENSHPSGKDKKSSS